MAHLVHDNRVPEMQVRRCGVKTDFHPQRFAALQLFMQHILPDQFRRAAPDKGQLPVNVRHCFLLAGRITIRFPPDKAAGACARGILNGEQRPRVNSIGLSRDNPSSLGFMSFPQIVPALKNARKPKKQLTPYNDRARKNSASEIAGA
jgi:hypothetical protein